jgi:hypothetical protein
MKQIEALKPELLVVADSTGTLSRLVGAPDLAAGSKQIAAGLKTTLDQPKPAVGRVVALSSPPLGGIMQDCVSRVSSPSDFTQPISGEWFGVERATRAAAQESGASYLDAHFWFWDDNDLCPGFVGPTPVRADGAYLTVAYSQSLAPPASRRTCQRVVANPVRRLKGARYEIRGRSRTETETESIFHK